RSPRRACRRRSSRYRASSTPRAAATTRPRPTSARPPTVSHTRSRRSRADIRSPAADLKYKEQQFQRMQELRGRGLVAQQALDDAANNLAAARAKQDSNTAALSKAQNLLGGLPQTPDEQLAGYKLALAQLAQAKLDLEHATVRAPMDGVIGKTTLQPGDFLTTRQAAMPLVANPLGIDANYKETDLTHVAVGQNATIEVDTFP